MADFEDRHPDAGQRDEIALNLFQHRQRQHGRTGGEVEDAMDGCHGAPKCNHEKHENTKTRKRSTVLRAFVTMVFKS